MNHLFPLVIVLIAIALIMALMTIFFGIKEIISKKPNRAGTDKPLIDREKIIKHVSDFKTMVSDVDEIYKQIHEVKDDNKSKDV